MTFYKKFPTFVIVHHYNLLLFTFKEAVILSLILLKCDGRVKNKFPYQISLIIKETGIARNTVIQALIRLRNMDVINILNGKEIYLTASAISVEEMLDDIITEKKRKRGSSYYSVSSGHTNFNFELMKILKLNETQYAILHSYFILSKKTGYARIGKGYFLYYFRIKERQFKYIKSKLIKEKYISKHPYTEEIYVEEWVRKLFNDYIISDSSVLN